MDLPMHRSHLEARVPHGSRLHARGVIAAELGLRTPEPDRVLLPTGEEGAAVGVAISPPIIHGSTKEQSWGS
jgi:hypothetical protein